MNRMKLFIYYVLSEYMKSEYTNIYMFILIGLIWFCFLMRPSDSWSVTINFCICSENNLLESCVDLQAVVLH